MAALKQESLDNQLDARAGKFKVLIVAGLDRLG